MAVRVSCHGLVYSLFEVEEVLSRHHAVLELLAFTVMHTELGHVVGIAVVASAPVTVGELRAFGSGLLPTSLLPTVLVWVDDALPLDAMSGTSNLRDELPALLKLPVPLGPGFAGSSAACHRWEVCATPGGCGDVRLVLRLLWRETLQLPSSADCGSEMDDVPFGAYGGDSLLAARLIGLAREHGLIIPDSLQFSLERLSITQLLPLVTQLNHGRGIIKEVPLTGATGSPALATAESPAATQPVATQPAATGEGVQQPAALMSVRIIERDCRNPTQPLRATGGLSACAAGDLEAAQRLASEGWAAAHAVDKHGNTALQWAAGGGHLAAMRWLLEAMRADVDGSNKDGRTALMWACKNGCARAASLLLDEAHADASLKMKDDSTAFDWAVLGGDTETMELLASHPKVDIHALNKFGCAAVQWAAAAGNVSTCRWLVSKGVSFEHVNNVRHGALNKAAVKGHVDAVRWLLYAEDGPKLTDQLLLLDLEGRTVADLCYLMRQDAVGAWLDELIAIHRRAEEAKGDGSRKDVACV